MTCITSQLAGADASSLTERLRSAGIVLAHCNTTGMLISPAAAAVGANNDMLLRLLLGSPLLRRELNRLAATWQSAEEPGGRYVLPGLWCEPMEIRRRRRRTGYGLLLIPTNEFVESEQYLAMCGSAELDALATRAAIESSRPVNGCEVDRVAMLGRLMFADAQREAEGRRTVESMGQQLAELYEEINLLYSIGQTMTVMQRPPQFIRNACRGLLDTMPYRLVGALFSPDMSSLPGLADKLFLEGTTPGAAPERIATISRRILQFVSPDQATVLDPRNKPEHGEFIALGDPVLIHPISREGKTLGVMFAAGKHGTDRAASSVDLKLLAATATHAAIFLENVALYEDMDAMFVGSLAAISAAIDAKDTYTRGHSQRVAHLSQELARAMGLDDESVRRIHIAGLVHDVGKIGVPESVLRKPGRLTDEEFDLIKQHPEIGFRILKDIPQLRDVLPGVLHHHERWDGRGYPHGLSGEDIPLYARIIALADSFDAMSSTRTYRAARQRSWVLDEIRNSAGSQFDPDLAPLFLELDFAGFDALIAEHRADWPIDNLIEGEAA